MQIPLQITFRGMEASDAMRAAVEEHVKRLERFAPLIMRCEVVVSPTEHRHHQGNHFEVRIHLTLPRGSVNISHGTRPHTDTHTDAYVALRDAFDAARRQIEDQVRKLRHDVKTHTPMAGGRISRLYKEADYGLIETRDSREIHFHRHSVVDGDFDKLQVGEAVRFVEVAGDQGPWASTVYVRAARSTAA